MATPVSFHPISILPAVPYLSTTVPTLCQFLSHFLLICKSHYVSYSYIDLFVMPVEMSSDGKETIAIGRETGVAITMQSIFTLLFCVERQLNP